MLPHIIIKDFIKAFKALDKKRGDVSIEHLLYGNQKIKKCILHPLVGEDCIGLVINGEDKYITMNELLQVYINDNDYCIQSDLMKIHIML